MTMMIVVTKHTGEAPESFLLPIFGHVSGFSVVKKAQDGKQFQKMRFLLKMFSLLLKGPSTFFLKFSLGRVKVKVTVPK